MTKMFFNFLSCLAIHVGLAGCGFIVFIVAGTPTLPEWVRIAIIALGTLLVLMLYFITGITFEKGESSRQKEVSAWGLSALLLALTLLSQVCNWTALNEGLFLNAPFLPLWMVFDFFGISTPVSALVFSVLPSIFIWLGVKSQKTALYRWFRR